jgi:hypothetical protein
LDFGHKIMPMKFAPFSIAARASSTETIPHTFTNGVVVGPDLESRPARPIVVASRASRRR